MIVAKFGGTSVGSAKNIKKVIDIIAGKKVSAAVVVSAVGGITNKLISAGQKALKKDESYVDDLQTIRKIHFEIIEELFPENPEKIISFADKKFSELDEVLKGVFLLNDLSEKTAAKIVSTGELLLSYLLSEAMKASGMDADLKDSRELIKTNSRFENAEVNYEETYKNIREYFSKEKHDVVVLPGFIASDNDGEITTLGRGGSDFTAAILANAVNADVLEIWTDVSGMFTANPKLVKQAKPIQKISYQEAMELSHFGAKVIYPPTIQPALDKKIPILIKNTMKPEVTGTLIRENANGSDTTVKGISHIENITLLTLEGNGMVGVPGISKRLFGALSDKQINVKFITQASSEHSICLAISESETQKAKEAVDKEFEYEILQHKIKPLIVEKDLAIIALVGDKMKSHQGISGKMFSELGSNNVNIRAIAQGSTEKNISVVIAEQNIKKALNSLHAAFFENHIKQLNLFIVGVGNVGAKLIDQINQQQDYLLKQQHLNIRVIGLSSSKKMLFDEEGIDLNNWESLLAENGEKADLKDFYNHVKALNLRNSVFIDNTANKYVPEEYPKYLKDSVAVVACNKIACSSEMEKYKNLKYLSRKYHAPFLFETNVGAGLPIIDTLNNLIASGDRIEKIQAVLSGSLNFIFNNFDAQNSFYDVVKQAGTEGYTEPDPRIDLSGVDVMRKILILIRESGIEMELNDIKNESFLPDASLNTGSVEEFMENLKQNASHFEALREKAKKADSRLKYVAEFNDGKAKVGLQLIPKDHPFYNLEGKDNIVLFYTGRYADQPLIIKGAGAGADVTASGIFGDIIRTGNR
jgi:aspartokinase/homoserine dehydrogenase 1